MTETVSNLMEANLFGVFNERDAQPRALTIESTYAKASPVYQTRGFGYLAWKLGPDGGDPVARGFDVAVVRNDLISELYAVITT